MSKVSLWVAVGLIGAVASFTAAGESAQSSYALTADSSYSAGCMGSNEGAIACLCPILWAPEFNGRFVIEELGVDEEGFDTFLVKKVNWNVELAPDSAISGGGIYRIGEVDGESVQQLTMDLSFDGGDMIPFDSGLVPGGESFPDIEISVSVVDAGCYDVLLNIDATPERKFLASEAEEEVDPRQNDSGSTNFGNNAALDDPR